MTYIEFENVKIIGQRDKFAFVRFNDEEEELWIPWSVIEDNDEDFKNGYEGKIQIAEWWAETEGLI